MTGEREDKRKPLTLELDKPNQKQESFLLSKTKYTAYGGARGGGEILGDQDQGGIGRTEISQDQDTDHQENLS